MNPLLFLLLLGLSFLGPLSDEPLLQTHTQPLNSEKIILAASPEKTAIDRVAEQELFKLVNDERTKAGLDQLLWDEEIAEVARAHSYDMWVRRYFAHENPDGERPGDRMSEGEVDFGLAGENLALAKAVRRAHDGLMNSPGHRRNILDPNFTRIGIGVIDGGDYGKMFTQNFAD